MFSSDLKLIVIYSDLFGDKFIRNLVNTTTFCISCAEACDHCREGKFNFSTNIVGIFKLPDPATLPEFIEEGIEEYMPQNLPEADLAIVSGVHNDILLELPYLLKSAGIKAMIVPIEASARLGIAQVQEICEKLEIEFAAPKPFCELDLDPDKPVISQFIEEFGIGRPKLNVELDGERIARMDVIRSAPCGCTWYIAKQLRNVKISDRRELWDRISEAHHSYPCTASMEHDSVLGDTILHKAGYIAREAVEEGIEGRTIL